MLLEKRCQLEISLASARFSLVLPDVNEVITAGISAEAKFIFSSLNELERKRATEKRTGFVVLSAFLLETVSR